MNAIKKMVLATSILMPMGLSTAEAAVTNFTYTGSFVMYDGTDPANLAQFDYTGVPRYADPDFIDSPPPGYNPNYGQYIGPLGSGSFAGSQILNNGNGAAGDPISGTMAIDMDTGAGSATMTGKPFFGQTWKAHNINFVDIGSGVEHATMLWDWDIQYDRGIYTTVALSFNFQIVPTTTPGVYNFATTASWLLDGPFVGAQPTYSGVATVVPSAAPVPAAGWLLGSGLIGLISVARRKAA